MRNTVEAISKNEVSFWIMILMIIIGGIMAFTNVNSNVRANQQRGSQLRTEFNSDHELVEEINNRTIRMETNQRYIMNQIGIDTD